jgi:hypothetical protein
MMSLPMNASKFFLYSSFGLGGIIVLLCYAALFHIFSKTSIVIVFLLALTGSLTRRNWNTLTTGFRQSFCHMLETLRENWYWFLPIFLLISLKLLLPLYPPTRFDETLYHLPQAKNIVTHSGLSVNPYIRYPLSPQNMELLYALSLLFYDDILPHLFHASTAFITAMGIYSLGALTSNRKTGAAGALIFLSSSLVQHMMASAYIDLGTTLFVFSGFYCLSLWLITKKTGWLYFAGFATGIAVGTKYTALLYALFYTLWVTFESRNPKHVVQFLVPLIVFGSPWYIRNYLLSGDPVFPSLGPIFGYSRLWSKGDYLNQYREMLSHGTPRNIFSFVILPWNLIANKERFMDGAISLWMLAIFPSFFFVSCFDKYYKKLSLFVFLNIIIWFFSTQILRYLLPLFPMISLLSAYFLVNILYERWLKKLFIENVAFIKNIFRGLSSFLRKTSNAIVIILLLATVQSVRFDKAMKKNPLPVTQESRTAYLIRTKPAYKLIHIANFDPSLNIYQYGFGDHIYYAKGKILGDDFGPARYSLITGILNNSEKMYETFLSMDIQLFLINKQGLEGKTFDDFFSSYFVLIAENENGALYGIRHNNEVDHLLKVISSEPIH